jgi:Ca2+/Na+ antiporter
MVYSIAAGNERTYGSLPPPINIRTPGDVPAVITAGATTVDDVYAYFSSYGPVTWYNVPPWNDYPYPPGLTKPDVCAPGYQITSVRGITGGYSVMSGTSMATPHVSGFAALILEVDPDLTNAEVRKWMEDYALDLGTAGKDNDYGSGRIRCYETISAMKITPITLTSFTARAAREGVSVRWTTGSEKMLAGFNLYRRPVTGETADNATASYVKLNRSLIKGRNPYVYADADVNAEDLSPLRLHRLDRNAHHADPAAPRLRVVSLQVVVALGRIVLGAFVFVDAVGSLAAGLGVDGALLALVIAPIATELPEKFNSVIWIRGRKDTLAMGNITGAMVFQSAIPTVVALLFAGAAWTVTEGSLLAFASAGIAFASVFAIFGLGGSDELRGRRLLLGGGLYVVYLALVAMQLAGAPG